MSYHQPVGPVEDDRPLEQVGPAEPTRPAAYRYRYRRDVESADEVSPTFRMAQLVYVIFGIIIALIIIRVILKALAANPGAGFTSFIYGVTGPLVAPFQGIFATPQSSSGSVFEFSALVAIVVYALVAWVLVRLIEILGPRRVPTTE